MAAFDLCARRVYRFVDAANSPSCSSFLSLFPLPLGVSFSLFSASPYLVLVLRGLIIYHGRKECVSKRLCCYPKKRTTTTFRFGYWSK